MSDTIGELVVKISADMTSFNKGLKVAYDSAGSFGQRMEKIGKSLTSYVTLPLLAVGAASIKMAADMEMSAASFETMLGSAEAAADMLAELRNMAANTPFEFEDLADATKTLLQFGVSAEDSLGIMRMLGDVSMGNADRFNSLSIAFGQMSSAGRLMGQDLLQMINAGFNPLRVIAEQTGKSMLDLKKDMEAGRISTEMVTEAFRVATSEGGQFYGGMERGSQTLSGLFSTLKDNVKMAGAAIGGDWMPGIKEATKWAITASQGFQSMDTTGRQLVTVIGGITAAVGPAILGIRALGVALKFATVGSGPIIAGIAVIIAAISGIAIAWNAAKTSKQNYDGALAGSSTTEKEYQDALNKANELLSEKEKILKRTLEVAPKTDARRLDAMREEINLLTIQRGQIISNKAVLDGKTKAQEKAAQEEQKALKELQDGLKNTILLRSEEKETVVAVAETSSEAYESQFERMAQESQAEQELIALYEYQGFTQKQIEIARAARHDDEMTAWDESQAKANDYGDKIAHIGKYSAASMTKDFTDMTGAIGSAIDTVSSDTEQMLINISNLISDMLMKAEDGTLIAIGAVLKVATKAYDVFSDVFRNLEDRMQSLQDSMKNVQMEILNNQLSILKAGLDATLLDIDTRLQAELAAAGFLEKTEKEQLEERLAKAIAEGDTEEAKELERALRRQEIIDRFAAEEKAARDAAAAEERRIRREEAILNKQIATINAEINREEALAEHPFNRSLRAEINSLYDSLIDSIESIPIPALAMGSDFTASGPTVVGEQGIEIVNMPRGASVIPNHEISGVGNTFNFYSPIAIDVGEAERLFRISQRQMAFSGGVA